MAVVSSARLTSVFPDQPVTEPTEQWLWDPWLLESIKRPDFRKPSLDISLKEHFDVGRVVSWRKLREHIYHDGTIRDVVRRASGANLYRSLTIGVSQAILGNGDR